MGTFGCVVATDIVPDEEHVHLVLIVVATRHFKLRATLGAERIRTNPVKTVNAQLDGVIVSM